MRVRIQIQNQGAQFHEYYRYGKSREIKELE